MDKFGSIVIFCVETSCLWLYMQIIYMTYIILYYIFVAFGVILPCFWKEEVNGRTEQKDNKELTSKYENQQQRR